MNYTSILPDSFFLYLAFALVIIVCDVIDLTMLESAYKKDKSITKRDINRKRNITFITVVFFIILTVVLISHYL